MRKWAPNPGTYQANIFNQLPPFIFQPLAIHTKASHNNIRSLGATFIEKIFYGSLHSWLSSLDHMDRNIYSLRRLCDIILGVCLLSLACQFPWNIHIHDNNLIIIVHMCCNYFFVKTSISLNHKSNGTIVIHLLHHGNITQTLFAWIFIFIAMIILWGWISWRWDAYIFLQKTIKSGELVSIKKPPPRLCDTKSAIWKKRMVMVAGRLDWGDPSLEGPRWACSDALTLGGHLSSIIF